MIEFHNVSYAHNKGQGVNGINMTIGDSDFTFLIGPTGSGKTTLMRLIYFDLIQYLVHLGLLMLSANIK